MLNPVSLDEVLEQRKDFSNEDGLVFKAITSPGSWDEDTRSATFIMSAETEDRHRDIVVQSGIRLETFNRNPIAFFNHQSYETPIGAWEDIKQVNGRPKRTEGRMVFCDEGVDDMADKVARHVAHGSLRAASIGFRPIKMSRIEDDEGNWTFGYKFDEVELYECSIVTIPAVREALIKGDGNIREILSAEVVEEFLEHLKGNPAVAQLVDKTLFEDVYREATGNKTTLTAPISVKLENLDSFNDLVVRMEKAAGLMSPPEPDPLAKELEDGITATVDAFSQKLEQVDDEERKGFLSGLVDNVKSVFVKAEEPELADDAEKQALRKKLKALAIEEVSA